MVAIILLLAISNDTLFAWISVSAGSNKTDWVVNLPIWFNFVSTSVAGSIHPGFAIDSNSCSHTAACQASVVISSYTNNTLTIRRAGGLTQRVLFIGY